MLRKWNWLYLEFFFSSSLHIHNSDAAIRNTSRCVYLHLSRTIFSITIWYVTCCSTVWCKGKITPRRFETLVERLRLTYSFYCSTIVDHKTCFAKTCFSPTNNTQTAHRSPTNIYALLPRAKYIRNTLRCIYIHIDLKPTQAGWIRQ